MSCNKLKDSPEVSIFRYNSQASLAFLFIMSEIKITNVAVFSEKTDFPHLPNQSMVAISVMKLWPWKLGQGHQNLISYWYCPIYIGFQIW